MLRLRVTVTALALLGAASGVGAQAHEAARGGAEPVRFIGAEANYVSFFGDIDAWTLANAYVGQRSSRGTYIGRVSAAQRFATNGVQLEADAYPRFNETFYAYLNLGYSSSTIFPEWRSGAELFANLPRAWEASAGYRQLRFTGSNVTLFTGSIARYVGNSWVSLRPYVREKSGSVSASLGLTARRYYADADNFIGGRASFGTSPTDRIDPSELARSRSWSLGVQGSRSITRTLIWTWSAGYESETVASNVTRKRIDVLLGARRTL